MPKDSATDRLWQEYARTRATSVRNQLVEQYRELVIIAASKIKRRTPHEVSYEELLSAGYDGLIDAVESFDSKLGIQFDTFSGKRITGSILDWLRSTDPVRRTTRRFERARDEAWSVLSSRLRRPPTDAEMSRHMNIDPARFDFLNRKSHSGSAAQLSILDDSDKDTGYDHIDHCASDPSARIESRQFVHSLMLGLNPTEKIVIMLYYVEGFSGSEIGTIIGKSESRVAQIRDSVLARLRGCPRIRALAN